MALNSSDIGLMAFQKFLEVLRSGKTKSLVEYTSNFRAEPFVMIDSECVFIDEMYDIMQSLQSQYAAYYLLAMSAMTTIGSCSFLSHLVVLQCIAGLIVGDQCCSFLSHLVVLQYINEQDVQAMSCSFLSHLVVLQSCAD